jgi:hypothetical protein
MSFVADVMEMVCIDNVNGDVIASSTLQESGIDVQVKETEIRGSRGNALQTVLHSDRDVSIKTKDSNWRYDVLAKQLGQSIVTGVGVAWSMPKVYTAVGTGSIKITLDNAPLATGHGIKLFKVADGTPITSGFTVAGSDITFSAGVVAGDQIEVRTYKYNTPAKTETLNIDNAVFAKGMTVILETLEIDSNEKPIFRKQFIFDSAIPDGNFSINTTSERNGVSPEFNLRVVKPPNSTVVGRVLRIPIA